mmetsp:Transcript_8526/g.10686  ORF Transcript_8526/g.10686 Transcript_8526/m.10686 type:complete len:166 (+) Transcript_8526:122-619(+)
MANDHPEFFDYAQRIEDQRLFNAHQEWKHNTFFGKLTTSVLSYAQNSDFFGAIADGLSYQNDNGSYVSPYARTISICLVLSIVIVGIVGVYAIGNIVQTLIGDEIVIEQEIIIEETVKLSDLMKENGDDDDDDEDNDDNGNSNDRDCDGGDSAKRRNKKIKCKVQ